MAHHPPSHKANIRIRVSGPEDQSDRPASPRPLHHHPVVAISLLICVGALVQIGVWLVMQRLPATNVPHSSVIVHGFLFDQVLQYVNRWTGSATPVPPAVFTGCMAISLLSGIAWYAATRLALAPAWGVWVGLCWMMHPAFAFLVQRPTGLAFVILGVPLTWWLLLWWKRRRRRWIAFLAGAALGVLALNSFLGLLLLPLIVLAMIRSGHSRKRWSGAGLAVLGFILAASPLLGLLARGQVREDIQRRLAADLWSRVETDDGSPVASAAASWRKQRPPWELHPLGLLWEQAKKSPVSVLKWFGMRLWRSVYATGDGRLQTPLLVLQLLFLVPGIWGYVVAVRYRKWRWMALTASGAAALFWFTAALAEPLARNLTPVGGFAVLFALVGVADVYERIFGRRLTGKPEPLPVGIRGNRLRAAKR